MSDIIDFNKIKNTASDKDLAKFEDYIYGLYYDLAEGILNFADFTKKVQQYMDDNNLSQQKFDDIENKLLQKYEEEYGMDFKDIESQMKNFGLDLGKLGIPKEALDYNALRKTISFAEKYDNKVKQNLFKTYQIKNDTNQIEILLNEGEVIIISEGVINLSDNELNEFLVSYKKTLEDKQLSVKLCENVNKYEY